MATHAAIKPGNIAVVTGAGYGGIGFELAKFLLEAGMRVALVDNDAESLEKAQKVLSGDVTTYCVDVSNHEQVAQNANEIYQKFGKIDFLALNAGVGARGSAYGEYGNWVKTIGVNLWGVVNGCQEFVPRMVAQNSPGIIWITGSKQGITCPPGNTAYNVSKSAVKTLAEGLSHQLRTDAPHISVHLVVPGWVFTKLTAGSLEKVSEGKKPAGAWLPSQVIEYVIPRIVDNEFYIICPDNEVSEELDKARMSWTAMDVPERRPALSRWHPAYKEEFDRHIARST